MGLLWLDRDAFDETVAILTGLATSHPSPADIAQAVGFWEEKQSRFARSRRLSVRGAIAADIEEVRTRTAQQNGGGGGRSEAAGTNPYSAATSHGGPPASATREEAEASTHSTPMRSTSMAAPRTNRRTITTITTITAEQQRQQQWEAAHKAPLCQRR